MSAALQEVLRLTGADTPVHPASAVKASWPAIVRDVARHGEVIVTHHNRPEVVLLDIAAYAELVRRAEANDPLRTPAAEFEPHLAYWMAHWRRQPRRCRRRLGSRRRRALPPDGKATLAATARASLPAWRRPAWPAACDGLRAVSRRQRPGKSSVAGACCGVQALNTTTPTMPRPVRQHGSSARRPTPQPGRTAATASSTALPAARLRVRDQLPKPHPALSAALRRHDFPCVRCLAAPIATARTRARAGRLP